MFRNVFNAAWGLAVFSTRRASGAFSTHAGRAGRAIRLFVRAGWRMDLSTSTAFEHSQIYDLQTVAVRQCQTNINKSVDIVFSRSDNLFESFVNSWLEILQC